jgi:hypothetical protein
MTDDTSGAGTACLLIQNNYHGVSWIPVAQSLVIYVDFGRSLSFCPVHFLPLYCIVVSDYLFGIFKHSLITAIFVLNLTQMTIKIAILGTVSLRRG